MKTGAITSKFRGTGQTCVCANRIYVQSTVYADFACRLAEKVSAFKVGDGLDEKTYYSGCVVNSVVADSSFAELMAP
jgi:succinate-semialdehyde dehydrogenase/glutarate-semialdehyde dehydrogenase